MSELDKSVRAGSLENPIRLTETVQKGGCAAKLPAGQLRQILKRLEIHKPKSLLVGTEYMDDACVWDLGNGNDDENAINKPGIKNSGVKTPGIKKHMVQTLDFFTPIVDDPYDFGAIAAANALSDVYAMGGEPKIALSILAFPSQTLDIEILQPLLTGALEKIHEAGACLAGGHTIDDDTLKFGLSVTGFVDSDKVWTNQKAQVGDVLILTKALGTGTLTSALKRREAEPEWINAAIQSMKQLNRAPDLLPDHIVHAATDVTGFGLAGHALQMARASGVHMRMNTEKLPCLPGAMNCLERKITNRAHRTNLEYVQNEGDFSGLSESVRWLTVDPQTSGGLLLSVPAEKAGLIVECLRSRFKSTEVIGEVLAYKSGQGHISFI